MVVTGNVPALAVRGRLDASTVSQVRDEIATRIESTSTGDVVVDVSEVTLVDSTGLGVLAAAHLRLERAGRRLVLRGCTPSLHRILAMTRLLRVMHVEPVPRQA